MRKIFSDHIFFVLNIESSERINYIIFFLSIILFRNDNNNNDNSLHGLLIKMIHLNSY